MKSDRHLWITISSLDKSHINLFLSSSILKLGQISNTFKYNWCLPAEYLSHFVMNWISSSTSFWVHIRGATTWIWQGPSKGLEVFCQHHGRRNTCSPRTSLTDAQWCCKFQPHWILGASLWWYICTRRLNCKGDPFDNRLQMWTEFMPKPLTINNLTKIRYKKSCV